MKRPIILFSLCVACLNAFAADVAELVPDGAWCWFQDPRAVRVEGKTILSYVTSGGAPGKSKAVDEEYRKRSPLTYMANAKGVKLHISAGIHDGHKGSVPISHSLLAFNKVAAEQDQIAEKDIKFFVEKAKVPPHLKKAGKKGPLFRRTSGNATITIFNGAIRNPFFKQEIEEKRVLLYDAA